MTGIGLLFLVGALNAGTVAQTDFDRFAETASGWLLAGQGLPRDYRVTLMQMEAADRIRAIAYLRRLGLMTGRPWPIDDILRPATDETEPPE
ncbi:hypothetical protein [Paracoccus beibuensis]|uniref:hypothetical protein n=1 Tax=Paracoccus beibuensis TaxID=547602 RepID=UPI002240C54A|nr:hypothetical protein [Paracoccus beibuensis]